MPQKLLPFLALSIIGTFGQASHGYVQKLFDDYLTWKFQQNPLVGSYFGFHEYDALMPTRGLDVLERQRIGCQEFLNESDKLIKTSKNLTSSELHSIKQILFETDQCVRGFEFKGFLLAEISFMDGVQTVLPKLFRRKSMFKLNAKDGYDNVIERLLGVPNYLKEIQELLELGMKQNVTFPKESLIQTRKQFEAIQVLPEQSPFYSPFLDMSEANMTQEEEEAYKSRAKDIVSDIVLPAFRDLDKFVHYTYLYSVRRSPGLFALPNGKKHYKACLDYHTTSDSYDAEKIHQLGLDEVVKLRKEVMVVAEQLGFRNVSMAKFFEETEKREDQYFETTENMTSYVKSLVFSKIVPALSGYFEEKLLDPKLIDLDILPIDIGKGGIGFYREPSYNGNKKKGAFYFNGKISGGLKKMDLLALTLHESIPGHHLHLGVANKIVGLPKFRKMPRPPYPMSQCPTLVPMYNAFIEGWGLYSEFLGIEMGLYNDPFDLVGFYGLNLLRAARLVVDSGIHHYGWTRAEVVAYLLENTKLTPEMAGGEADRYISLPGQAVSYKIGELKIKAIRARLERDLGDDFSLKQFHTHLLSCMGTLDTMSSCVENKML